MFYDFNNSYLRIRWIWTLCEGKIWIFLGRGSGRFCVKVRLFCALWLGSSQSSTIPPPAIRPPPPPLLSQHFAAGRRMACSLYMLVVAKPKLQPPFPSPTKPLSGSFLLFHCQQPSPCEYSRAASLRLYALPSPKVSSAKRVMALAKSEPLRVMISGAPAPGEGTRCELITEKVRVLFSIFNFSPLCYLNFSSWRPIHFNSFPFTPTPTPLQLTCHS